MSENEAHVVEAMPLHERNIASTVEAQLASRAAGLSSEQQRLLVAAGKATA